jgi:hypothetical protein
MSDPAVFQAVCLFKPVSAQVSYILTEISLEQASFEHVYGTWMEGEEKAGRSRFSRSIPVPKLRASVASETNLFPTGKLCLMRPGTRERLFPAALTGGQAVISCVCGVGHWREKRWPQPELF